MTDLNTQYEYYQQIKAIASELVDEAFSEYHDVDNIEDAEELINDSLLHETIDGHQWVIYNGYNVDVMRYSDNEDYYIDNFGAEDAGTILQDRGLSGLHNVIAYWCMYADVQEQLDSAFDEYEEKQAA